MPLTDASMTHIEEVFARNFDPWGITLPTDAVTAKSRGDIRAEGWTIQFLFGHDDRGEYLDYYASHRMADDSHVRIRASGDVEILDSIVSCYFTSDDPVEAARLKTEYTRQNRTIAMALARKGFR